MIPYEELRMALEAYAARRRGGAPSTRLPQSAAPSDRRSSASDSEAASEPVSDPVFEDRSNELDIGDVLSDEEAT